MQRSRRLAYRAFAVSVLVHVALAHAFARWLERDPEESDPPQVASEMVLPLAEWILVDSSLTESPLPSEPEEPADSEEEERKKALAYVRTTVNQESLTAPGRPDFISDRNTLAAAELEGRGPENLPTVDGEDEDTNDLENRRYRDGALIDESPNPEAIPGTPGGPSVSLVTSSEPVPPSSPSEAAEGAKPVTGVSAPLPEIPDAIPLPKPNLSFEKPDPLEEAREEVPGSEAPPADVEDSPPEPAAVEAAAVAPTPPGAAGLPVSPAPSTVDVPDRNVEAFQSETRRAKLEGGAKRKGYAAYDAENTPIGRYRKAVSAAIERAWQVRMLASRDFMGFNVRIKVEFTVNRWGKVQNVRVPQRAKNAVLTNQTLAAILEARLPEMPPQVHKELDGGDLPCFYNFRIH